MEKFKKAIEDIVEFVSFGKIKLCICVNTEECKGTKCCKEKK
jgi:hypothetical protein